MSEQFDPNYGICEQAASVLAWEALASTALTPSRAQAVAEADQLLFACNRCFRGSLLRGDPTAPCALEGNEYRFTALGPWPGESARSGDMPG